MNSSVFKRLCEEKLKYLLFIEYFVSLLDIYPINVLSLRYEIRMNDILDMCKYFVQLGNLLVYKIRIIILSVIRQKVG